VADLADLRSDTVGQQLEEERLSQRIRIPRSQKLSAWVRLRGDWSLLKAIGVYSIVNMFCRDVA
jgi:hypothetical protein